MPYVQGFLIPTAGGPTDPGYGNPGAEGPVDPGYGHPGFAPVHPGHLPSPPPGVWPPPTSGHPIVPAPPGTPPGTIWPSPGRPVDPGYGHPGGGWSPTDPGFGTGGIDHPSTGPVPVPPGGEVSPPIHMPSGTFWVVAGIPGIGWRYVAVDPSLKPTPPMAPTPTPKK